MPTGVYTRTLRDPVERFMERITVTKSGCWIWNGSLDDGYGSFYFDGRKWKAHIANYHERKRNEKAVTY